MLMILWMLPILILVTILVAILFIAFAAMAISLVGGISVAALVKNKDVKKFLISSNNTCNFHCGNDPLRSFKQ